jgi:hypothetical protein
MTMTRLFCIGVLLAIAGCGSNGDGERCNPLRATSDCNSGLSCVYPTAPSCGNSYCCAVDSNGNIRDPNPSCQPDPSLASLCSLDLAMSPLDAGGAD